MMHVFKLAIRELLGMGFTSEMLMDIIDDITLDVYDGKDVV